MYIILCIEMDAKTKRLQIDLDEETIKEVEKLAEQNHRLRKSMLEVIIKERFEKK